MNDPFLRARIEFLEKQIDLLCDKVSDLEAQVIVKHDQDINMLCQEMDELRKQMGLSNG